jgi:hypothetical protein
LGGFFLENSTIAKRKGKVFLCNKSATEICSTLFAAKFIVVIVAIGFSPSIQNGFLLPRSRLQKH